MKKLLLLLVVSSFCIADQTASRLILKHREHNGVGYDTGYSTLQAFLAPSWKNGFMPFIDLRGHVFDDQKFATNAGVGLRYEFSEYTFGSNFYIDYRNATHLNPFQLAGGLEFLSDTFDIRANGYGPFTDTTYASNYKFQQFSSNGAIFKQTAKAALPVIEAEVGAPIGERCNNLNFYAALGPYYLFGKTVKKIDLGNAVGGKGRLVADYNNLVTFSADATYDKLFKWTVQGTIGLSVPLGPRKKQADHAFLCQAQNQLPHRAEIIPIDSGSKKRAAPFNIVFVNNTSSSNGTFESPYPTLALAEANSSAGDVIYVFPGDGTTTGMSSGITLKDRQRLHGSGHAMDLDGFVVPVFTPNVMPKISNAAGSAVTLSNENTVIGMNIVSATAHGIDSSMVSGGKYLIADNLITSITSNGINVVPSSDGHCILLRNTITNAGINGIDITATSAAQYGCFIKDNIIKTSTNIGFFIQTEDTSNLNLRMRNNQSLSNTQLGIEINSLDASTMTALVKSNQSSKNGNSGILIQGLQTTSGTAVQNNVFILNNTFNDNGFRSLGYNIPNAAITSTSIQDNQMAGNTDDVLLRSDGTTLFCVNFVNNYSDNNYNFARNNPSTFQIVGSSSSQVQSENSGSMPNPITFGGGGFEFVSSCR